MAEQSEKVPFMPRVVDMDDVVAVAFQMWLAGGLAVGLGVLFWPLTFLGWAAALWPLRTLLHMVRAAPSGSSAVPDKDQR